LKIKQLLAYEHIFKLAYFHIFKLAHFQIFKLIKNIIFDLGGVFMNLDFNLTQQAFVDLGVSEFAQMFTQHHANDLFEDLETGKISPEIFYDRLRQETNTQLTNDQIKTAWNALILDFPPERMEWLKQIGEKYKVFLFSNTNQIHYDAFMEILARENNCTDFNEHFIKAYYSHEMGLRKPYVESFQKILEEHSLIAAETLFIDDTYKNIEGANKAGLQTIHLLSPLKVTDLNL